MLRSLHCRTLLVFGLVLGARLPPSYAANSDFRSLPSWIRVEALMTSGRGAASGEFVVEWKSGEILLSIPGRKTQLPATDGDHLQSNSSLESDGASRARIGNTNTVFAMDRLTLVEISNTPADPTPLPRKGRIYYRSRGEPSTNLWVLIPGAATSERIQLEVVEGSGDANAVSIAKATSGGVLHVVGTEFHLRWDADASQWVITMVDGSVRLGDEEVRGEPGHVEQSVLGGEGRLSEPAVLRLSALRHEIQWLLYYPAVVRLEDLAWAQGNVASLLADSFRAYEQMDLREAWLRYQQARGAVDPSDLSPVEVVYRANLLLGQGRVDEIEPVLLQLARVTGAGTKPSEEPVRRIAYALLKVIAAVRDEEFPGDRAAELGGNIEPRLPTEWLAESYYQQSRVRRVDIFPNPEWRARRLGPRENRLARALAAAQWAVSPEFHGTNFWFGWARLANLHFSHGDLRRTQAALEVLEDNPFTNAPTLTLEGFVHAAHATPRRRLAALESFQQAVLADPDFTDAWLGLGLMEGSRSGFANGPALPYLEEAAAREPGRSLLRSYLGKAYFEAGHEAAAEREFNAARNLDPNDPTPLLYSALAKQSQYRVNEAVRDLEKSIELNSNRAVYRSDLLLDQDQAVRGANLAAIYRDAGLPDVSVREATKALQYDYANGSAHLFLANSYDSLRDPQQVNLRYETPWLSELLLANLLQPVGAGALSQTISQQEYSRLFYGDHAGIYSLTELTSDGDWLQNASLYLTRQPLAVSFDLYYLDQEGFRPNQDQENLALWSKVKYQIGLYDTLFFQMLYSDVSSGDLNQYYDPASARQQLRLEESQVPLLALGHHHEWASAPEHHTLLLFSRLDNSLDVTDPNSTNTLVFMNPGGTPDLDFGSAQFVSDLEYESELEIYSGEVQHIWQPDAGWWIADGGSTIVGARIQAGTFETTDSLTDIRQRPIFPPVLFPIALGGESISTDFERYSFYGYQNVEFEDVADSLGDLAVTFGLSYDYVHYPINHRASPVSNEEDSRDQFSPKAGLVWSVSPRVTLRAAYTKSLGGVSLDQSFRLEPTQVAGFLQSYRSLIPESVAGATVAPRFETWGTGMDAQLGKNLYFGLSGEWLESEADKVEGVVDSILGQPAAGSALLSAIDYRERSINTDLGYLLGDTLSFTARYRLGYADYEETFANAAIASADHSALLHELNLGVLFNYSFKAGSDAGRSWGFFSQFETIWRSQDNCGYEPDLPDDEVWQSNIFVGLRFPRRSAELRLGILNLTDADYRLNPLNLHRDLPRERTFFMGLRWNFERGI